MTRVISGRKRAGKKVNDRNQAVSIEYGLAKTASSEKVRFGSIVVHVFRPGKTEIKSNVESSTEALMRSKAKLTKSDVTIRAKKDVPLYHVDENDAQQVIRKLNGKIERGVFENGVFKASA